MTELDYQKINERLRKLERQNRILKQIGCIVILIVVVALFSGATDKKAEVTKEIKARKIILTDSKGKARILMFTTDTGQSGVVVLDDREKRVIEMSAAANGSPHLSFHNSDGKKLLAMGCSDENAVLGLFASNEEVGFGLYCDDVYSSLDLYDPNKNEVVHLASNNEYGNGGFLRLKNGSNEVTVQLHTDEYGNGIVGAYNRKGVGRELKPGP